MGAFRLFPPKLALQQIARSSSSSSRTSHPDLPSFYITPSFTPAPSSHLLVTMFIKSTLRTVSLVARQHQTRFLSTSVVSQSRRSLLAPLPSIITGSDSSVPRPSKEAMAAHYNQYLDVEEAEAVSPAATATATVAATEAAPVAIASSTPTADSKEDKSAGRSSTVHLVDGSASYRFSLA